MKEISGFSLPAELPVADFALLMLMRSAEVPKAPLSSNARQSVAVCVPTRQVMPSATMAIVSDERNLLAEMLEAALLTTSAQ